jgi:hypothetical protein
MSYHSHKRMKIAVKRSVHFILTKKFSDSIRNSSGNGVGSTFTREFWKFLDDKSKNQETRKNLRQKLWTIWLDAGEDTLSSPFAEGTKLIVSKRGSEFTLSLKETAGELTELNKVNSEGPSIDNPNSPESMSIFEALWTKLLGYNGNYPSQFRPLTASVAQVIAARTGAPMPIVCAAITKQYTPSEFSNGFEELSNHSMPDEVFDETLVARAIENGVAERTGPAQNFTFKVKKGQYQEWQSILAVQDVKNNPIIEESEEIEEKTEEI